MLTPTPLQLIAFQAAIALTIFLGLNWLGRKSDIFGYETLTMFTEREDAVAFNFLFRAVTPVVLIILIAALCYSIGLGAFTTNLHHAVAFYIVFRVAFNVARGRSLLLPWRRLSLQWVVTLGLTTLAYTHLITKKEYLFPDLTTVGNEVWLAIGGYLYVLSDRVFSQDTAAESRGTRYVRSRRRLLERRFGHLLDSLLPHGRWRTLVMAVLIVEDFNRPSPARMFERLAFRLKAAKTLGIMQVKADRVISDAESVSLGIQHLLECYDKAVADGKWRVREHRTYMGAKYTHELEEGDLIHNTLVLYNPSGDYARDVRAIFEKLLEEEPSGNAFLLHPEPAPTASSSQESEALDPTGEEESA